ncbi:DUF4132 domain-containing protein [Actinoplanes sp. NEAU-A12]|uniref:DUF4132 domain-containing protein n=1 Tax=Actinoplanes sandaracinus TaxID=3045177 RepID=A0ABT6WV02_9ACTN|nr:DUF4132 domain-containing protein [Actinoplanes sandaracinus]MDI6103544.1 DUF4132 domain-containing protein [Actinoplanes sandaracinus]
MADVRSVDPVETFVVPSAWKRFVLPRRRGGAVPPPTRKADVEAAEVLLSDFSEDVRSVLDHHRTPDDLAEAGHAFLAGDPAATPLGAAVVARGVAAPLPWHRRDELAAFADHWRSRHGLPFAAAATAELAALYFGSSPVGAAITRAVPDGDAGGLIAGTAIRMAYHLRRAIVATSAGEYAEVVAALGAVRGPSLVQRAVASVMAPDEAVWADEICAALLAMGGREFLKGLLLTVAGEPFASRLAEQIEPWAALCENERVYTFAATLGPAAAPALTRWLDAPTADAKGRKRLLSLLSAIGGDEAFTALLERIDHQDVPPALADAAGRAPARALRLLAEAPAAERLLRDHLVNHRAVAAEVRPLLAGPAADRFDAAHAVLAEADSGLAAPGDLPPIPVSPPWLAPVARKPLVVTGLSSADEVRVEWAPGERETWGDGSWAARHGGTRDWAPIVQNLGTHASTGWDEKEFFLSGPDELTLPRVAAWRPSDTWDIGDWGQELLARYGTEAVAPLTDAARRAPVAAAPLLAPVVSPAVAMLMAGWHARSRSVRPTATAWFARHTAFAARALIPAGVGRAGQSRSDAEAALRVLPRDVVLAAAAEFGAPAVAAVEEVLAVDPLTILPRTMPTLPDWANPAVLPPVRLTGGRGALPVEAVRHLLTMLAVSRADGVYPGLTTAAAECEAGDLAEFAWALFGRWREAGHPAKQGWAFGALGVFGDDETVRRLAPVIRAWPGEGGHARAVAGLDVLAAIGTDVALMYLNGIAQKVKFRGLKDRAVDKIAELAAELGLTSDELADRLVPDLGLDAAGSMVLDYGRRTFTVGFDEQLKPFVADGSGKRLKALPKPGAQDDPVLAPESYARFAALKKDVRAIAADQVRRLERAMVDQRRWTGAAFGQFLAAHPLLRHLVRRLVWVRFDDAGRPAGGLRLAEDHSLAGVTDDTVTLGDTEQVGIAHPLHLGGDLAAWGEIFADYEILQPFPQLGRGVEPLTPARAAAFVGRTAPSTTLLGLERRGWRRGAPQDGGVQGWFERDVPGGLHLVLALDPGIAVGAVDVLGDQTVEALWVAPSTEHHWFRKDQADRVDELDPITAAETLRELTEVLP